MEHKVHTAHRKARPLRPAHRPAPCGPPHEPRRKPCITVAARAGFQGFDRAARAPPRARASRRAAARGRRRPCTARLARIPAPASLGSAPAPAAPRPRPARAALQRRQRPLCRQKRRPTAPAGARTVHALAEKMLGKCCQPRHQPRCRVHHDVLTHQLPRRLVVPLQAAREVCWRGAAVELCLLLCASPAPPVHAA